MRIGLYLGIAGGAATKHTKYWVFVISGSLMWEQRKQVFIMLNNNKVFEIIFLPIFLLMSLFSLPKQSILILKYHHPDIMLHPFDVLVILEFFVKCCLVHLFDVHKLQNYLDIVSETLWLIMEDCLHNHLKKCFFVTFNVYTGLPIFCTFSRGQNDWRCFYLILTITFIRAQTACIWWLVLFLNFIFLHN